ncbi:MAG: FkbM family methyltransferase, partial [Pirellulales bacterium]
CMRLITPDEVICAIEKYVDEISGFWVQGSAKSVGNALSGVPRAAGAANHPHPAAAVRGEGGSHATAPSIPVLIDFRHGLGDAVQLTTVLLHLRHYHPDWQIDVAAGIGKLPSEGSGFSGQGSATATNSGVYPLPTPSVAPSLCPSLYHRLFVRDRDAIDRHAYQQVFELSWDECQTCYADSPSTKAEHCLRSVFKLEPIPELCRYELTVSDDAMAKAKAYFESICGAGTGPLGNNPKSNPFAPGENPKSRVVLLHYQANTSTDKKDLSHELARRVCEAAIEAGYVPVILDWDKRSPLPDGVHIFNPGANHPLWSGSGTGDAEVLAALIAQASLFIGVDSGPLHVAGAVCRRGVSYDSCSVVGHRDGEKERQRDGGDGWSAPPSLDLSVAPSLPPSVAPSLTPTIAVWTGHHPLHYFGLAEHVTHLVPEDPASRLRGHAPTGLAFFEKHYRSRSYRLLDDALPALVQELLAGEGDGLLRSRGFWIRRDNAEQDLVIVRDIAEDDSYRIAELDIPGPVVLDVGAHIGVFSRAFKERHPSARVIAVECCPENIAALRRNVDDFAAIVPAALTYERDVALLNAVYPGCVSTGGSRIVPRSELEDGPPGPSSQSEYWSDTRPLATITLEQLMAEHELDRIDVLKLDCEGSEFSILENTTSLAAIGSIIGEYHGRQRFLDLVARKFSDWQLRILRDGDPGTFWLVRPNIGNGLGVASAITCGNDKETRRHGDKESADAEAFWRRFLSIVHPIDQPAPASWRRYYTTLFGLALELRPRRVCEIGVRAGYSAFTILSANPHAFMLGVEADFDEATHNTHCGRKGLWRHAEKILAPFNYQLLIADSHTVTRLPTSDLIYIDGDHTFDGCLADLRLAERSTDTILVDDYDSIPGVRRACDQFAAESPAFTMRYIDNGLTGFALLQRSASRSGPPSGCSGSG